MSRSARSGMNVRHYRHQETLTQNPLPIPPASGFVVYCLCAEWCGTCRSYAATFEQVGTGFSSAARFVWVDIEEDERFADMDVETFPTISVQRDGESLFHGPLLPHAEHLQRLVESCLAR